MEQVALEQHLEPQPLALEAGRRSLSLTSEELRSRVVALGEQLAEVRRRRDEVESHLDADVRRLTSDVLDPSIGELRQEATARARAAVEAEARRPGSGLPGRLRAALDRELRTVVDAWASRLERELGGRAVEIGSRYGDETSRLVNEVARLSAGLFDVDAPEVSVPTGLSVPSRFSFRLEDQGAGLDMAATGIRRLVPGRLGRALARAEALHHADEMADRHAGRLRYDLSQRLDGHRRAMVEQLREATSAAQFAVTAAVDSATAARARGEEAIGEALSRFEAREQRVEALRDRLHGTGSMNAAMQEP